MDFDFDFLKKKDKLLFHHPCLININKSKKEQAWSKSQETKNGQNWAENS